MSARPVRASHEDALHVPCPDCDATAGNPCVYLPITAALDPHLYWTRTPQVRARIDLIGKPTVRPHNGRFAAVWQQKVAAAKAAREERAAKFPPLLLPHIREIARAHQQWDRQEWIRLNLWFRRWGHIFVAPSIVTKAETEAQ